MTVTAVVCSHANPSGLRHILGQLRYQTRPPDETIVLCSDTPDVARLREEFPEAEFLERPNREDWGHEKRDEGLCRATSDWVGFFNDDDSYSRRYLELMLSAASTDVDAVYCNWNEQPDVGFHLASSTAGNFLVRRGVGRQAGYTDRVYEADGLFINRVSRLADRIVRVDEILYHHNVQR